MVNPFATSELLKSLSRYPVSKLGVGINQQASALSGQANGLRETLENDLPTTVKTHRKIANEHRAIASKLPSGKAKQAHLEAAQAHEEAASEIDAIRPVEGNSIASNALTADKAQQYSSRAANYTNAANQAVINKGHFINPDISPDAQRVLEYYDTPVTDPNPNLKAIAGIHWTLAHEHRGVAEGLELQASIARANNGGGENDLSRQLTNSALINRQAAQAHFSAGNAADENSYSTSKVEGGWKPQADVSYGNNKKMSQNAFKMSQQADKAKNDALANLPTD
jgi:hypothetical protein